MSDQLMDDLVRAVVGNYLGEKIKAQNIKNQGGANMVYLHGQDIGRKLGMPQDVLNNITPFPASTTIVVQQEEQKDTRSGEATTEEKVEATKEGADKKSSGLRRILSYLGIPAITAGTILTGMAMLIPDTDKAKEPKEPVPVVDTIDPNFGFTIEGFNKQ